MNNDEILKLENQLCFAFYACSREITKLYRPILAELDLTYTQYITLLALWEKDQVTVKELGSRLLLDSGTLTPLLKKLENMSLLTRVRNKSDERNLIIGLTDKGIELKSKAINIPAQLFAGTSCTAEELISLRDQANALLHKLESSTSKL
ncbi:MAG: MarR family winged helix-turn-helix transcriptional regulator [Candidatus Pristimantibacillus sp.]